MKVVFFLVITLVGILSCDIDTSSKRKKSSLTINADIKDSTASSGVFGKSTFLENDNKEKIERIDIVIGSSDDKNSVKTVLYNENNTFKGNVENITPGTNRVVTAKATTSTDQYSGTIIIDVEPGKETTVNIELTNIIHSSFQSSVSTEAEQMVLYYIRVKKSAVEGCTYSWKSFSGTFHEERISETDEYFESRITWKASSCSGDPVRIFCEISYGDNLVHTKSFLPVTVISDVKCTLPIPGLNPQLGTINFKEKIRIFSSVPEVTFRYTIDKSDPRTSSTAFVGSLVSLEKSTTLKVIVRKNGWNDSPVVSAYYDVINNETLIYIAGGTFRMGSEKDEVGYSSSPTFRATLSSFYIGRNEVTQRLYHSIMGNNPSRHPDPDLSDDVDFPVDFVSWYDAVMFCNALSRARGVPEAYKIDTKNSDNQSKWKIHFVNSYGHTTNDITSVIGFRLPTEAEWEYAARLKANGSIMAGHLFTGYRPGIVVDDVAWLYENSDGSTHEVCTKLKSDTGLCDMMGNVHEWSFDWYKNYTTPSKVNPFNHVLSNKARVKRGGAFSNMREGLGKTFNASRRFVWAPTAEDDITGFRIVISTDGYNQLQ